MTILSLSSYLGILLVAGLILVPRLLNYVANPAATRPCSSP